MLGGGGWINVLVIKTSVYGPDYTPSAVLKIKDSARKSKH